MESLIRADARELIPTDPERRWSATAPGRAWSPARRLGPYEVCSLLAAGGMGEVYRARDTRLGRDVAIKTLPETLAAGPGARGAPGAGGAGRLGPQPPAHRDRLRRWARRASTTTS